MKGADMLKGKTVLITGAGGGIGRACAVMMAHEHAQVFITGRREEPLKETAQMITEQGGVCDYCCCDVSKEKEVEALLQAVSRRYGRLDTLVNNAAVFLQTDIRSPELEDSWQKLLDVNVMGMVKVIHAALPYLIENGSGSIINLSSIDAFSGCVNYTGYSAAKGAVVSLTRGLALELGQYDIRVNAVAPGITRTDMVAALPKEMIEPLVNRIPLRRIGEAEDIANAFLFLSSDMASYVTGEILSVDGAMRS